MNFPFNLANEFAAPSNSQFAKIEQLLEENNQLILLSLEAMTGQLDQPNTDVAPAVPFLQKLQKNLLHLALLAEQSSAPHPPAVTPGDLSKLRELLFTVGEDPAKLAQILGKPVELVNMMLTHLKQSFRFFSFLINFFYA